MLVSQGLAAVRYDRVQNSKQFLRTWPSGPCVTMDRCSAGMWRPIPVDRASTLKLWSSRGPVSAFLRIVQINIEDYSPVATNHMSD
jgi:hypothetical protein